MVLLLHARPSSHVRPSGPMEETSSGLVPSDAGAMPECLQVPAQQAGAGRSWRGAHGPATEAQHQILSGVCLASCFPGRVREISQLTDGDVLRCAPAVHRVSHFSEPSCSMSVGLERREAVHAPAARARAQAGEVPVIMQRAHPLIRRLRAVSYLTGNDGSRYCAHHTYRSTSPEES